MNISTFEAKCADCKNIFAHPSFGDISYGNFIFSTIDGKHFIYCDAHSDTATLISKYFPQKIRPEIYRYLLASLADQTFDLKWNQKLTCPKCHSTNIEYWHGKKVSSIEIKPASFYKFLLLNEQARYNKVMSLTNAIA